MNKTNMLWGLILVIIGVIFGLNALDITDIDIFFNGWWTLFIIIPCLISLFKEEEKMGNIIGVVIGFCLFLGCQGLLDFDIIWKLMIPFILVMIGLSIIFKDVLGKKVKKEIKKLNKENKKEYCSTFSSQDIDLETETFEGANVSAIFGGVKFDIRDAIIKEDAIIDVSAIFGGVTIYVPNDINVKINSTSIFGGVSNERRKKKTESKTTIYINATCMFGGVEIK